MEASIKAIRAIPTNTDVTLDEKTLMSFTADHLGTAKAVQFLYGDQVKYTDAKGFAVWKDNKWTFDRHAVRDLVTNAIDERRRVAAYLREREIEEVSKNNRANVAGVLEMLADLVVVEQSFFDHDIDHLPTPNGILDLRTGELKDHDPEMGFTFQTTVEYDPDSDYTWWEEFLLGCTGGDAEAVRALQLCVGYCLTGHTREEKLLYIHGKPRAGKGVFTESVKALLGDPVFQNKNFESFTSKRTDDTNCFDMASLQDARAVFADETNGYTTMNTAKIKQITGGSDIEAAWKGKDATRFVPRFKIILTANQGINGDADDSAFWSRIISVEFPNSYVDREDRTIKERFKALEARRAILAWAVKGAQDWYKEGLLVPQTMKDNLAKQRAALDNVGDFLEDCVDFVEDGFVPCTELTAIYKSWCDDHNISQKHRRGLKASLERRGIEYTQVGPSNKRIRVFRGIVAKEF